MKVGNLKLSLFSGSVEAQDISIADDPKFSNSPFIKAKSLQVGVEMMPLIFSKALHVTGLTLEKPEITVLRTPTGVWNYSSIGNSSAKQAPDKTSNSSSAELSVKKLNISDGKLYFGNVPSKGAPHVYDRVNVEVRDFSFRIPVSCNRKSRVAGGRYGQDEWYGRSDQCVGRLADAVKGKN